MIYPGSLGKIAITLKDKQTNKKQCTEYNIIKFHV